MIYDTPWTTHKLMKTFRRTRLAGLASRRAPGRLSGFVDGHFPRFELVVLKRCARQSPPSLRRASQAAVMTGWQVRLGRGSVGGVHRSRAGGLADCWVCCGVYAVGVRR